MQNAEPGTRNRNAVQSLPARGGFTRPWRAATAQRQERRRAESGKETAGERARRGTSAAALSRRSPRRVLLSPLSFLLLYHFPRPRREKWSGWWDLNPRLRAPKARALARLRHTPRLSKRPVGRLRPILRQEGLQPFPAGGGFTSTSGRRLVAQATALASPAPHPDCFPYSMPTEDFEAYLAACVRRAIRSARRRRCPARRIRSLDLAPRSGYRDAPWLR